MPPGGNGEVQACWGAITIWDHLTARNLVALQRIAALKVMGEQAKQLLEEGYPVDADRVLDEINERKRAWQQEMTA